MTGYRLDGERADIAEEKKLWFEFIKSNLTEIKEKYCSVAEISFLLAYIEHTQLYNLFKALHNL